VQRIATSPGNNPLAYHSLTEWLLAMDNDRDIGNP
jgi:hypothetical protein